MRNWIDVNSVLAGDTKATTRRLSDIPTSINEYRTYELNEGIEEPSEEPRSVLGSVHEIVAKALGGGPRGRFNFKLRLDWSASANMVV